MNSRDSGRRRPRRHPAYRLVVLLTMSSLWLGMPGTVEPTAAQTATTGDPAAGYQMWRDDEIFVPLPVSDRLQSTSYEYSPGDKSLSDPLPYCQPTAASGWHVAAAAGRIMSPYSDQVVVAYPGSSGNLEVRFADGCNLANPAASTGPPAALGAAAAMPAPAAPLPGFAWWYDIASGDLDKHPDADLNYRDEVVVAYATATTVPGVYTPVVAVLDYTTTASAPTITWMTVSGSIYNFSDWAGHDVPVIPLSVVTGDFDGDTHKEIAVAFLPNWNTVTVAVFRYTTTETDGVVTRSLDQVSPLAFGLDQPSDYTVDGYQGTIDAAAGDFNGDGKDELSVAAVAFGYKSRTPRIAVDLKTFEADANLTMKQVSTAIPYEDSSNGNDFVSGVQIAAGLFKYVPNTVDPVQNFDINRRQLALATNGSSGALDLRTLVYDAKLTPVLPEVTEGYAVDQRIPPSGSPPGRLNFWLAAGGFNGLQTTKKPAAAVWSLALTTWADNGQVLYLLDPDPSTGALTTTPITTTLSTTANPSKSTAVAPVVAYDYGKEPTGAQTPGVLYGDAQYLGAPLYFRIDGTITPDYILQEPPKHVYWDSAAKTVVNVSGQDAFTLGTTDTQSVGMTSEYHDTEDHTWGVSETGLIGFSTKSSLLKPPAFEISLSETFAYEFADHVDDYNKDQTQRTVTLKHMATRDDAISYRVQQIDVWRYPVFGVSLQDPNGKEMPYAYFDITAPVPGDNTYLLGGIDASDWYQPVHENGNILSYPAPVGEENPLYDPTDMGSFQVPCTDVTGKTCDKDGDTVLSTQTITGPLLDVPTGFTWSGTGQTVTLVDSRSETTGKAHTWSKTLKNSEDLKATGRIKTRLGKVTVSGDVAFNGKWSWGGAHTMEMKTDNVSSIELTVPPGVTSEAYNVYPSFYVANNGTVKVGFAVDTDTIGGKTFWDHRYYAQPDPALNLPLRFNPSTVNNATVWTPNMEDSRKLMRGFFVRRAEPAPPDSNDYPDYDGPPTVGDQVRLEARVYNYSLGQTVDPPGGMKVRFDYAPIDPSTHRVAEEKRTEIGTTTVGPIGPRKMTTAAINWDTSTLELGMYLEQDYRIYVVLDPDDAVMNEKYETESPASRTYAPIDANTKLPVADCSNPNQEPFPAECIDPGQNNEGWREVKVMADYAGDPRFGTPADVHLQTDALAARDPRNPSVLLTDTVQIAEGQPLHLRVKVDTDGLGADYAHLLFYDGDPQRGGRLFADKQAFTGNPLGSYVWADWIATEPGLHRLYAQLVESSDDTSPGNAIDDMEVVVHTAGAQTATQVSHEGCAITRSDGDGGIWLILVGVTLWAHQKAAQRRQRRRKPVPSQAPMSTCVPCDRGTPRW